MGNSHSNLVEVAASCNEQLNSAAASCNEQLNLVAASCNQQLNSVQKRLLDEIHARAEESAREARAREAQARADGLRELNEQLEERKRLLDEIHAKDEECAREAQAREDASREAVAAARSREEAALAKAAEATTALLNGIWPIVMPTTAQVQAAMERMQYDPEKLHFGVCGTSGSGKSSLINGFRGLNRGSVVAAAVGVSETTSEVTRFPDSRNDVPYSRFVWYDIPGAGTTAVPDLQYFNDQGLFVLDFIVMVYGVRFTQIDVGIIENCYRFNIPVFIVRSKADQHIDNMMKDEDVDRKGAEYEKVYEEMKTKYVGAVRSDFRKHMEAMAESPVVEACDREMILSMRVYIVSCANVGKLLQSGAKVGRGGVDERTMIDEVLLLEDMVRAAANKCYSKPEEKGMLRKGRDAMCAGFSSDLRL